MHCVASKLRAVCYILPPLSDHLQLLTHGYLDWGDVDALTEAGFCYAKGVGCKKDLKKSAHFYRLAEAKGIVMPGNSW